MQILGTVRDKRHEVHAPNSCTAYYSCWSSRRIPTMFCYAFRKFLIPPLPILYQKRNMVTGRGERSMKNKRRKKAAATVEPRQRSDAAISCFFWSSKKSRACGAWSCVLEPQIYSGFIRAKETWIVSLSRILMMNTNSHRKFRCVWDQFKPCSS